MARLDSWNQTWNVELWLVNSPYYQKLLSDCSTYAAFLALVQQIGEFRTPDGVAFDSDQLNYEDLEDFVRELKEAQNV